MLASHERVVRCARLLQFSPTGKNQSIVSLHSDGFFEHIGIKRYPEQQEGLERYTWKGYSVNGNLNEIQPVEHQVNRLGEKGLDLIHGFNIIVLLLMGHLISHVEKPTAIPGRL